MAEGGIGRAESETESIPGDSSLYSRHSQNYVESVSVEVCNIMTRLGYGQEIRWRRIEKYKEFGRLLTAMGPCQTLILAGSKGQGLSCYLESDFDFILCCPVPSVWKLELIYTLDDTKVFRMGTLVYPGHCRLLQERRGPSIYYPMGFKGSEYKHVEWMICFNTGEVELINNLNDTQAKAYVLLKMIVKDVLKPCYKEITSYVLKNVILWQAESNPQTKCYELRTAISTNQLSFYMIPERNLMAACVLKDEQQRIWLETIMDMMEEGPRIILRLQKIRQAVISYPEPLLFYCRIRTELEMLMLDEVYRRVYCMNENGVTDETVIILQEIRRCEFYIVNEVFQRMLIDGSAFNDLYDIGCRMLL